MCTKCAGRQILDAQFESDLNMSPNDFDVARAANDNVPNDDVPNDATLGDEAIEVPKTLADTEKAAKSLEPLNATLDQSPSPGRSTRRTPTPVLR